MPPADAPSHPDAHAHHQEHHPSPAAVPAPVLPGNVAIWLFLATEIMFFTGLLGTFIV